MHWGKVIVASVVVVVALGLAIALRIQMKRLLRRAEGTRWAWDDLAARLLRDVALPGAAVAGAWAALLIVDPSDRVRDLIQNVLLAMLILAVTLAAARLAAGIVGSIAIARQGVASSVTIFANIARVVVLGLGVMVLLQSLGVSITPLLGALGVGGLAVALALQDTLANLFAGIHVLAAKTMEPGHYIKLSSGQEGYVVDINWRNTTIRTLSDNLEVIPNARFSDTILTNFHRPAQDMSLLLQAKVAYGSDLDQVERVTAEVATEVMAEVDGGVVGSEVLVRFHTFAESSINFTVILRTREFGEQFRVKHEFVKRLHGRFREEGIQIPLPAREVYFANGNGEALHGVEPVGSLSSPQSPPRSRPGG